MLVTGASGWVGAHIAKEFIDAGYSVPNSTLHPQPCTLHPQLCTLNPEPCTLNPAPYTLNHAP